MFDPIAIANGLATHHFNARECEVRTCLCLLLKYQFLTNGNINVQ